MGNAYHRKDANHDEIVKAFKDAGCEVLNLAGVGGGCPDILVAEPTLGELILVEIKNPKRGGKEKRTKQQIDFHKRWDVAIVSTVEDVGELLE